VRLPDEVIGGKAREAGPHRVELGAAPVEIGQLGVDQRLEGCRRRIGGERVTLPAGQSGVNETVEPAADLVALSFEVCGEPRSIAPRVAQQRTIKGLRAVVETPHIEHGHEP